MTKVSGKLMMGSHTSAVKSLSNLQRNHINKPLVQQFYQSFRIKRKMIR